jgi:hypothetical protein
MANHRERPSAKAATAVEDLFDEVDIDSGSRSSAQPDEVPKEKEEIDRDLAEAIQEAAAPTRAHLLQRRRATGGIPPRRELRLNDAAPVSAPAVNVARRHYYSNATRELYSGGGGKASPGLPAVKKTVGKKKLVRKGRPAAAVQKYKHKPPQYARTTFGAGDYNYDAEDREGRSSQRGAFSGERRSRAAESGDRE